MKSAIFLLLAYFVTGGYTSCGRILAKGVPEELKQKIVDSHNEFRACVALGPSSEPCVKLKETNQKQPQAENLEYMTWDEGLAKSAQKWANNCHPDHDTFEERIDGLRDRFKTVGQNLAWYASTAGKENTKPEFSVAIKDWFDEEQNYDEIHPYSYEDAALDDDHQIGHYTQLIWHSSSKVGCGYNFYETIQKGKLYYAKLYVCNYGPTGNVQDDMPYEVGQPNCEKHGMKKSEKKGLCVSDQPTNGSKNKESGVSGLFSFSGDEDKPSSEEEKSGHKTQNTGNSHDNYFGTYQAAPYYQSPVSAPKTNGIQSINSGLSNTFSLPNNQYKPLADQQRSSRYTPTSTYGNDDYFASTGTLTPTVGRSSMSPVYSFNQGNDDDMMRSIQDAMLPQSSSYPYASQSRPTTVHRTASSLSGSDSGIRMGSSTGFQFSGSQINPSGARYSTFDRVPSSSIGRNTFQSSTGSGTSGSFRF